MDRCSLEELVADRDIVGNDVYFSNTFNYRGRVSRVAYDPDKHELRIKCERIAVDLDQGWTWTDEFPDNTIVIQLREPNDFVVRSDDLERYSVWGTNGEALFYRTPDHNLDHSIVKE